MTRTCPAATAKCRRVSEARQMHKERLRGAAIKAMASRGAEETEALKKHLDEQLHRLLTQLSDLEEFRDELDDDEYEETKEETMEQMKEFEAALKEHMEGNMSLVDELGSVQLAIQAAIKKAFQTPEVIRLFAKGEHEGLRIRLGNIKRDNRLGKLDDDSYKSEAVEIILALKKLAVELTPEERHFLASASDVASKFESADKELGEGILSAAASGVRSAAT